MLSMIRIKLAVQRRRFFVGEVEVHKN